MEEFGKSIRARRIEQRKTIKDIAASTKLSPAYISRMERGEINPSVATIKKIADTLGINIADLFQKNNDEKRSLNNGRNIRKVLHENERLKLTYPGLNFSGYLLTPTIHNIGIEFILVVAEPEGGSGKDSYSHQRGEECILVQEGEMTLWIEDDIYILKTGESIHFESHIPHKWKNSGKTEMKAIWVIVPPTY